MKNQVSNLFLLLALVSVPALADVVEKPFWKCSSPDSTFLPFYGVTVSRVTTNVNLHVLSIDVTEDGFPGPITQNVRKTAPVSAPGGELVEYVVGDGTRLSINTNSGGALFFPASLDLEFNGVLVRNIELVCQINR